MDKWQLIDNSVYVRTGDDPSNIIAAFDFDNTLAWSDSGLIFMRTADDWVPTINGLTLINFFISLIARDWTIVIFTNQLENNPKFTQTSLERINNFITAINDEIDDTDFVFNPIIYVAIRDDKNRKPYRGMWDMFLQDYNITEVSPASFYCGDAVGPTSPNPLYRWGTFDSEFANNIGLDFYTPDEILGSYIPPKVIPGGDDILLIMAAHPIQYQDYINDLMRKYPNYVTSDLNGVKNHIKNGYDVIVVGERFATRAGRRRVTHFVPALDNHNVRFLMFTRPIKPYLSPEEFAAADANIRGYANALDYHPNFGLDQEKQRGEPFPIIRIN